MKATQLELFSNAWNMTTGAAPAAPKSQPKDDDSEFIMTVNLYDSDGRVCVRETIDVTMTLDPCLSCPLRDICTEDSCGQHLDEVDQLEQEYIPFADWLDAPLY